VGRSPAYARIPYNLDDGTVSDEREIYEMDSIIVVALISSVPGIIALIIQWRKSMFEEKLSGSQITEKITGAAGVIMDKMQSQINRLELEVNTHELRIEAQDNEILRLTRGINKLVAQIRKHGEEPCWIPDMESSIS
jgi:hypothetical protein